MNLFVYTDGACKGNPGKGGYAYVVYDDMNEMWVKGCGNELETTNNKMELTAVIEALKNIIKLYQNYTIKVYSDSAYVINCFNQNWINKWQKNNWKTNKGENVLNKDLWLVLNELVQKTGATFEKVKNDDLRLKEVDREAKLSVKQIS